MKNYLLKPSLVIFLVLLLSKTALCTDSLHVSLNLPSGNTQYEICIHDSLKCDYYFSSSPTDTLRISIPHGACAWDTSSLSFHSTSSSDPLYDTYYVAGTISSPFRFFVDLTAISCLDFLGINPAPAFIKVTHSTITVQSSQLPLNRPYMTFHPVDSLFECIKGREYSRKYELLASTLADYHSFTDTTIAEPEIMIHDVVIQFFNSSGTNVTPGDSIVHHIVTIACSDLPADAAATEVDSALVNHSFQKFPIVFAKDTTQFPGVGAVQLPSSFGQNWKVKMKERFACRSVTPIDLSQSKYIINSNLCQGGTSHCATSTDLPCDRYVIGQMNVNCFSMFCSYAYYPGDSIHAIRHNFLDLYNASSDTLCYGVHFSDTDSLSRLKSARRIYSMKFLLDSTYFSLTDTSNITVKTRDAVGNLYTLSPQPQKFIIHSFPKDTIIICFKSIQAGVDPDGNGPLTNIFPDPAHPGATHQYYCDMPSANCDIILQFKNIHFVGDPVLHNCAYDFIHFLSGATDAPTMGQVDLCLDQGRQLHYGGGDSCVSLNYIHFGGETLEGSIIDNHIPYSFEGNLNAYPSTTDLTVLPSPTQTDSVKLTYSFHQTEGISPWDVSLDDGTYHHIVSHYGETYYAHVSIPPGYRIVPDSGHYYKVMFHDSLYHYDTLLVYHPDTCNEYDLVLPGVSSSISFYARMLNCASLAVPGCLSQNHPGGLNPDSTVSFGSTTFKMEFRSQLNDAAHPFDSTHVHPSLKYLVYGCDSIPIHIHCFGDCPGTFVTTRDFTFERNTFGWLSDSAFINGTGHFTQSQSQEGRHRVYIGDRILATSLGMLTTPIPICDTLLDFQIAYPSPDSNPVFALDSCLLTFVLSGTADSGTYVFHVTSPVMTTSTDSILGLLQTLHVRLSTLHLPSGTSLNTLFHTTDTLLHNSIRFTGYYHVNCLSSLDAGHYMIATIRAQFMLSGGSGCLSSLSCDPWGSFMDLLILKNTIAYEQGLAGGAWYTLREFRTDGGYFNEVDFPGEYRPVITYPLSFSFHLPTNLFFSKGVFQKIFSNNSFSANIYDISGDCSSDTLNPASGGHCPGNVVGGPFHPGGTIQCNLDTITHKFSVNGDSITSGIFPKVRYMTQSKGEKSKFTFYYPPTCLDSNVTYLVDSFAFHFGTQSSNISGQTVVINNPTGNTFNACTASDAYPHLDTLLLYHYGLPEWSYYNNFYVNLQPTGSDSSLTFVSAGDTMSFCAHFLNNVGRTGWVYTPDAEIISVEQINPANCGNDSTFYTPLNTNNAGNLFYYNCSTAQTQSDLRFKIRFNCGALSGVNYAPTPITLYYGLFGNRCLLQTLNPDSTGDSTLLNTCGIHKHLTIYAQPEPFIFSYTAHADFDTVNFCQNDTIRIQYQLTSGQINHPQLQIVNTAFNPSQIQYSLTEGSNAVTGSFNGSTDTLTFPLAIHDHNLHELRFAYFPGCNAYNNSPQNFYFSLRGLNGCGDSLNSNNKDTTVHIVYRQFTSFNPFHSFKLKGDSIAGCNTTLHDTIRVTYASFNGSILFHIISPWLDSTWTSNTPDTSLIIPFVLHQNSSLCSSTYGLSVIATILDSCSLTHACPIGIADTVHKNIYVTCVNCCTNAANYYTDGSVDPVPGQSYNINQNIIINGVRTFDNNEMFIAPGVTITIPLGANGLIVTNGSHLHACNAMWQGIILKDRLIIEDSSIVEDAITAVYADTLPATVFVYNSTLSGNYTGLSLSNLSNPSVHLRIYGSTIHGGTLLREPYSGMRAGYGIKLNNDTLISIGDSLNGNNTLDSLLWGIHTTNSNLKVMRTDFKNNISGPSDAAPFWTGGYGIHAIGSNSITRTLAVGDSATPCSFTNCTFGINTLRHVLSKITYDSFTNCGTGIAMKNNKTVTINNNLMDTMKVVAISIVNPDSVDISIHHNSISHYYNGIEMQEPRKAAQTKIYSNKFNSTFNPNLTEPSPFAAVYWSVKLRNLVQGITRAEITDNLMINQKKGIYSINANKVSITSNYIKLLGASSGNQYGIWVVNSIGDSLATDTIIAPSDSGNVYIRGIRFESSQNCRIMNNYMLNTGTGINGLNYCEQTKIACNEMKNCMRGMMFENISLPAQGSTGIPQDNKWKNIALANRCVGTTDSLLQINWYHRYLQASDSNKFSPGFSNIVNSIENQTGTSLCDDPDTLQMMLTEAQIKLLVDSLVYPIYDAENHSYAKAYMFKLISEDSTLMNRGLPTDSMLQVFYNNMQRSTIAAYENIEDLITADNFNTAIALLFSMPDSNLMDRNLSVANSYRIYLLSDEAYKMDNSDSLVLDTIASELAIEGGQGSYIARAILDLEFDDNISAPLYRIKVIEKNKELIESRLYPNPNSGIFTYEYNIEDSCCYEISIMDIHNRIIRVLKLENTIGRVEISSLRDNGIYFLVLRKEDEIVDWKKIIVVK